MSSSCGIIRHLMMTLFFHRSVVSRYGQTVLDVGVLHEVLFRRYSVGAISNAGWSKVIRRNMESNMIAPGDEVESTVAEPELVATRRRQIADAARTTFVQKGYHPTRVRDIAEAAGVSIGTIYQYVRTKEDILFLVCEQGFSDWEVRITAAIKDLESPIDKLKAAAKEYYLAMSEIDDSILLMYQETKSLSEPRRQRVMKREEDITLIFENILREGKKKGVFRIQEPRLAAHNILVLAQMWGTKRWAVRKYVGGIEEFISLQTGFVLSAIGASDPATSHPALVDG